MQKSDPKHLRFPFGGDGDGEAVIRNRKDVPRRRFELLAIEKNLEGICAAGSDRDGLVEPLHGTGRVDTGRSGKSTGLS